MFKFLSDQKTIILVFLSVSLIGIIGFIFYKDLAYTVSLPYNLLFALKILSFTAYAVIAYFTFKGIKIFRWLMAVIVLLTGIHGSILGILGIEWRQYFIKPYFIVLGLYFIFGGIVLFRLNKT